MNDISNNYSENSIKFIENDEWMDSEFDNDENGDVDVDLVVNYNNNDRNKNAILLGSCISKNINNDLNYTTDYIRNIESDFSDDNNDSSDNNNINNVSHLKNETKLYFYNSNNFRLSKDIIIDINKLKDTNYCCLCGIHQSCHTNKHRFFKIEENYKCKKCHKFFFQHNHLFNPCFTPYEYLK